MSIDTTTAASVYVASQVKRRRATKDEMEERATFLIDYASEHGPITVRGLYYQAEVHLINCGISLKARSICTCRRISWKS
jgi:hypothetical protein